MAHLLIKDGVIENAIALEPGADYTPPAGYELVETNEWFSIGWLWVDGHPVDPNPPPPDPPV